jgi:hypothetical protein
VPKAEWALLQPEATGEPFRSIAMRTPDDWLTLLSDPALPIVLSQDERYLNLKPGRGIGQVAGGNTTSTRLGER